MSVDRVFATAKPEDVFVFRHNFSDNKWENVANKKDGSATVTFRKRGSNFFMRIVGDGGLREEHQLSQTTHVKDSGQGFIQVPLPEKRQLIGIKFKRAEMAAIFLQKIREQMNVAGPVTMQAVVIDDKPASDVPNPEKLPPAIGYGGGPTTLQPATRTPAPPPAQNTVVEATDTHPGPHPPADYPPRQQTQPVLYQHQKLPPRPSLSNPEGSNPQQQLHHPGLVGYNPSHQPYLHGPSPNIQPSQPAAFPGQQQQFHPAVSSTPYNPAPPIERQAQPQMMDRQSQPPMMDRQAQPPMMDRQAQPPMMDRQHQLPMMDRQPQPPMMDRHAQPAMMNRQPQPPIDRQLQPPIDRQPQPAMIERPVKASRAMVEAMAPPPIPKKPPPKPEPEIPSFSNEEPSDHAMFLANAINAGNFEAAHRMIHMLEKMVRESKKPQKKLAISYSNTSNGPSPDDTDVKLHLFIEFQSQYKSSLEFYLDFKSSLRISDIQQHLELSHHIPRATQNWIIGESLVKGDLLNRTLRDFDIDGDGTATSPIKVFIYVMHSKKAHVPKEEYEAIRQCQQEEWERKNQGRKLPWQEPLTLPTTSPPTVPPRSQPVPHQPEYPTPQMRRLEPAGGGFMGGQPVGQDFPMPQPRNVPPTVRQAWASPPHEDDTYARFNRNIPAPAMTPPPQRVQLDFDPTYAKLQNYQPHPAETRPRPLQAPPPNIGYSRPPFEGGGGGGGYVPGPRPHQPVHHQMVPVYPPEARGPPETRGPPDIRGPPVHYQAPQPEPVVPRPPPPAARQVGWSCPKCTFINKPRRPGCEICSADRPADYQIPEDIPMDADEARIVAGLQGSEHLFHQYAEAEKQKKERERAENFRALLQAEEEALINNDEQFDCPICFDTVAPGEGVVLRNCLHQFCKECLKETIMKSPEAEVKCPFMDDKYQCNVPLPEREIKQLVTEEELQGLYKRGLRQAESAAANSYHCKTTDCEGFCFYEDEVNHFHCPLCKKVNCLTCKAIHEGVNCQEYQDDLKRRAANDEAAKATQEMLQQMVEAGDAMYCPSCKIVVQKKDGCDWIRCSVCKTEICWATKQARWGPKGKGDKSGGCHCKENGKKCHPLCRNCH